MAATTSTIGTGLNYTTIAAWEDFQDGNPDNQDTGYCAAEVFAAVAFNGGTYTATNYPHLTAAIGAEHDGRAHEVSAAGNARIESAANANLIYLVDEFVRISWLEIKGPGDYSIACILLTVLSTCTSHIHHCIVHNSYPTRTGNDGIYLNDADGTYCVYRNIVYGHYAAGIRTLAGGANSAILCNTVYYNSYPGVTAGIRNAVATSVIKDNASFANVNKDFYDTYGVMDYNASADTTADAEGANSIADLTTANQFVAPTTTWAETDLLLKAGADIIAEGVDLSGDVGTYPEINVSIRNGATRATITGAWDIGADQYVAVAAGGHPTMKRFGGVEFCCMNKGIW